MKEGNFFRHELKHYINFSDYKEIESKLSILCRKDEFADLNGVYRVRSLYFDNYEDKVLREKVNGYLYREKFRIRYYNDDTSFMRLEKKSKVNGLCMKETVLLTKEECNSIMLKDFKVLRDSGYPLCRELYAKINYQLLRPKNIVDYIRKPFIYRAGNVRITVDFDIRGSLNIENFLNCDSSCFIPTREMILEVKYDNFLPQVIRDIVQINNRYQVSYSKYAAIRMAL